VRFVNPSENRRELGHVPQLFRPARVGTVTPACADKGWIPLTASATTFAAVLVRTLKPAIPRAEPHCRSKSSSLFPGNRGIGSAANAV
jgi:hypothetical protein